MNRKHSASAPLGAVFFLLTSSSFHLQLVLNMELRTGTWFVHSSQYILLFLLCSNQIEHTWAKMTLKNSNLSLNCFELASVTSTMNGIKDNTQIKFQTKQYCQLKTCNFIKLVVHDISVDIVNTGIWTYSKLKIPF